MMDRPSAGPVRKRPMAPDLWADREKYENKKRHADCTGSELSSSHEHREGPEAEEPTLSQDAQRDPPTSPGSPLTQETLADSFMCDRCAEIFYTRGPPDMRKNISSFKKCVSCGKLSCETCQNPSNSPNGKDAMNTSATCARCKGFMCCSLECQEILEDGNVCTTCSPPMTLVSRKIPGALRRRSPRSPV